MECIHLSPFFQPEATAILARVSLSPRAVLAAFLLIALLATGCNNLANPEGWAPPAFNDGVVIVFGDDNKLSALDPETGDALWVFPNEQDPEQDGFNLEAVYAEPIITGETIYVASFEHGIYALDPDDGSTQWHFDDISGDVIGTPAVLGERMFFGTTEGRLYGLTLAGEIAPGWDEDGVSVGAPIWASVVGFGDEAVIADQVVIVATMRGKVLAYAAEDGRPLEGWGFEAGGAVPDLALLPGDILFAPSFDSRVYLIDANSGEPINPDGYSTLGWVWQQPAISDGTIYFADLEGGVYALDLATGEEIWSTEIGGTPKIKASPVIVDGTLVVVDRSRSATFLDAGTGDARARVQLGLRGGTVRAPLRLGDDGAVYFVTTRGHLWRIDAGARTATEITGEEQA